MRLVSMYLRATFASVEPETTKRRKNCPAKYHAPE